MAKLILLQQGGSAIPYELTATETYIGRHPECEIHLNSNMVSRKHARVLPGTESVVIEDLGSGNGTYVNGRRIEEPTQLGNGDRVKLGPILMRFEDDSLASVSPLDAIGSTLSFGSGDGIDVTSGGTDQATIMESVEDSTGFGRLDVQPEAKLQAVLEISRRLARAQELNTLLPAILDTLFDIFPGADRGCILLNDRRGKLVPVAQKHRDQTEDDSVKLSRTVLNKVLETKTGKLSADAASDAEFSASESISSLSIRSMMAVPMLDLDSEVVGVIHIDTQNPISRFRGEDLDLLTAVAGQAALSYESARYLTSHLDKMKQDSEMEIARAVQRALLPDCFPEVDGYEFYASYDSAQAVGGDYYDAFEMSDGKVCLSFGDVAGKGVPGALIMSRIASCVQNVTQYVQDVEPAFVAINNHMCAKMVEGRFVTYVLTFLDPKTHQISLCNGGHMTPLIRKADGTIEEFGEEAIGLPIGVMEDYPYEAISRTLEPGETVVIITDGVDEAMNPQGDLYTKERVVEFLKQDFPDAEQLGIALLADVRKHAAGRDQNDDITIMAFGRNG
ncbi:SpoIIE family protein phosphatase [Stratiformator vulcanicus]|uniref:Phosphoserine phosphatase RsbU n=1 Tax=Stratiformator vulcanicus TaxID=2527980 RepID=A0A517R371_9PLAN|nr:SpoIIE family protein phosphatase [Stratiformator vulcanicus]QDT38330.1 Phosphoserine phosphatase RsbU [Stratiformator vulcanicus]